MPDNPSFELEADIGELPDVDSVVSELEQQGVDTFVEGGDGAVSDIEEEVETREVEETDGVEIDENGETVEIAADSEDSEDGGEVEDSEEVVEEPSEDDPEPVEEPKRSSSDYAEILAKKRELSAQEHALKTKSEQENDKIAELEARIAEITANSGRKPRSPSEALEMAGFDYETATKEQLGAYEMPEAEPVETPEAATIRKLQERLDEMENNNEKKAQEEQQQQYERAKAHMLTEIEKAATEGGHEYITHMGEPAIEYVNQVMVAYYQTHGQVLDIKQACDIVEKEYEADVLGKLAKSPKFQKQFQVSNKSETPSSKKSGKNTTSKKSTKTLKRGTGVSSQAMPDLDTMSDAKAKEQLAKQLVFHDD